MNTEIDWDLASCMDYNDVDFEKKDIAEVLAVVEGERDGADWHWIVSLKDNRYAYIIGGCNYTGWDCQSWATATLYDTPELACLDADKTISGLSEKLLNQVQTSKRKTWREERDREFINKATVMLDINIFKKTNNKDKKPYTLDYKIVK